MSGRRERGSVERGTCVSDNVRTALLYIGEQAPRCMEGGAVCRGGLRNQLLFDVLDVLDWVKRS